MGGVSLLNNEFYIDYLHDAHTVIHYYKKDGTKAGDLVLPGIGSSGAPTSGQRHDRYAFYGFTSFNQPTTIYLYDTKSHTSSVYRRTPVKFDPAKYTTEQVFATSKDGTKIPVFVTYKKGLKRDGSAPTILYGYGGFDIALTAYFSPAIAVWLDMGGVYAQATLRGGNEYGEDWHRAAMFDKKQNVFDDYFAAAHYLIDHKYTSAAKLAAKGESNGGLLVGAAITQHPELFGAALPGVGVMDMLRFQKFTSGAAWTAEYGSSDASKKQFETLYAYSPYQNVKDGTVYPATLVSTADHDDRVFPGHSFKFTAAMQHAQAGSAPVLIAIETNAGHGGGKPTEKVLSEIADQYAFLVKNLGFTPAF
jgi:prolyl oligopeptidase